MSEKTKFKLITVETGKKVREEEVELEVHPIEEEG